MSEIKKVQKVFLDEQTLSILKTQAEMEGQDLKNYLEDILKDKANQFELTEEYKILMDDLLNKHSNGALEFSNWEDFQKEL